MSHWDVSLDPELEVSWKSLGMYGGGVRREGKMKEKQKSDLGKWSCRSGGERFPFFQCFKSWIWSPPSEARVYIAMAPPG